MKYSAQSISSENLILGLVEHDMISLKAWNVRIINIFKWQLRRVIRHNYEILDDFSKIIYISENETKIQNLKDLIF